MEKLLRGVLDFRRQLTPEARARFAALALGQAPDALMVACGDSRVVPNLFASTDPGDLFVLRNVGNMIPAPATWAQGGIAAGIEYALDVLKVRDIICCGHSTCGAMQALLAGRNRVTSPALRQWLANGDDALTLLQAGAAADHSLPEVDRLSQLNVIVGLERLRLHPSAAGPLAAGRLRLHGWWFDIGHAEVRVLDPATRQFDPLDEAAAARIRVAAGR